MLSADWGQSALQVDDIADGFENESWLPDAIVQEPEEIESFTKFSRQRRDYTKQEKDAFEQWITSNPKTDKNQKTAYARLHGLTETQLQNLINNRRRRKALPKSKQLGSEGATPRLLTGGDQPVVLEPGFVFELAENMSFEFMERQKEFNFASLQHESLSQNFEAIGVDGLVHQEFDEAGHADGGISSLPVSNSNLLQGLSKKPSYSSIEEYLKSPDEVVPFVHCPTLLETNHSFSFRQ